jgi:hypothetical protein
MSSCPSAVKYASLSSYIARVGALLDPLPAPRTRPIFRTGPNITTPTLRSDRENRILLYPGCFNPPHHDHTALLWHIFLCTHTSTIAAMIFPVDEVDGKRFTNINGRTFELSRYQRSQLWQDEILGRFSWVCSVGELQYPEFRYMVERLAWAEGFQIQFVSTHGADQFEDGELPSSDSVITSDVTRPIEFVNDRGYDNMTQLENCRPWKKNAISNSTGL